jgi:hypothetical protein
MNPLMYKNNSNTPLTKHHSFGKLYLVLKNGWYCMGKIMQKAIIENTYDIGAVKEGYISEDKIRRMEVEFLVDTGAAMVCLPISSILAMGLKPRHILK